MLDFVKTSSKQHCKIRDCDDKLLTSSLYANCNSQQRESIHVFIVLQTCWSALWLAHILSTHTKHTKHTKHTHTKYTHTLSKHTKHTH